MKLQPIEREKKNNVKTRQQLTRQEYQKKKEALSQSDSYGQDDINKKNQYKYKNYNYLYYKEIK